MVKKMLTMLMLTGFIAGGVLFADQAELVFAAVKAKNDKEISRILQKLALERDFAQLDKVQGSNPELFDEKYFPGDFVNKVIFNYAETAAANMKEAQKAIGSTNPYSTSDWQWYIWDLDKALANLAITKDSVVKKKLQAQIEANIARLNEKLNGNLAIENQVSISLYLYALKTGSLTAGTIGASDASEAEQLNKKFSTESKTILEYLFMAGVPFSTKWPDSLTIDSWKRLSTSFNDFIKLTTPDIQSEYETDDEYTAGATEAKRLALLVSNPGEIVLPATITLGEYDIDGGFFKFNITLPDMKEDDKNIFTVVDMPNAQIRYYIDRKKAPFFKENTAPTWTAKATIKSWKPGIYWLKTIQVTDGLKIINDNLWAYAVLNTRGSEGETILIIDNYIKGKEFDFSGTKVTGERTAIAIPANGTYTLLSASEQSNPLWEKEISQLYSPVIGDTGPAGGIIFFDQGSVINGWRYLEAAPVDITTEIQWFSGDNRDINTGTEIGTGKANTDAIFAAHGSGSYVASICRNLDLGGFKDWFLPSQDELNLIYTNLKQVNIGDFIGKCYWSSSQRDSEFEWVQFFNHGGKGYDYKNGNTNHVTYLRPVRAF